jgi:hypothetical protein
LRLAGGKIIENVAAAAGDRQDAVMGRKLKRFQIHTGIFPDLIIDKSLEHQGEKPFQRPPAGTKGALMGGAFQEQIGHNGKASRIDIKGIGHLHDGLAKP